MSFPKSAAVARPREEWGIVNDPGFFGLQATAWWSWSDSNQARALAHWRWPRRQLREPRTWLETKSLP